MGRRRALSMLASALLLRPRWARAQPTSRLWRIGYLGATQPTPALAYLHEALLSGLRDRGYVEGRNLVIERRFAEGHGHGASGPTRPAGATPHPGPRRVAYRFGHRADREPGIDDLHESELQPPASQRNRPREPIPGGGRAAGARAGRSRTHDDRDMLQEMRLALRVHRTPGLGDDVPTSAQVFRMATEDAAATTPFGDRIGVLEVGRAADLVLLPWRHVAHPYLDHGTSVLDAVVHRARATAIDTVEVGGDVVLREGRVTRVDKSAVLEESPQRCSGDR